MAELKKMRPGWKGSVEVATLTPHCGIARSEQRTPSTGNRLPLGVAPTIGGMTPASGCTFGDLSNQYGVTMCLTAPFAPT